MDACTLTAELKVQARRLGFSLAGACPAVTPTGFARLNEWIRRGYSGAMDYLVDREWAYEHPRHVLDGARSVLMLALPYRTTEPHAVRPGTGRVSRYAWGAVDYHDLIHGRLHELADWLRAARPEARVRGVVDTAPLLERDFARLAGLGWIGKHTLLLNREAGSWFFLAALLTGEELAYDEPFAADYCGTCRACLDACPTQAFPEPYVLDARRCISYLTIELHDDVPAELRPLMGDWIFGCDVCQEVCPWNQRAAAGGEPAFQPESSRDPLALVPLLAIDAAEFRRRFRRLPLWRAHRAGLLRSAALALGNRPVAEALPALIRSLDDEERLIRGACAWSLGRYGDPAARAALERRLQHETDPRVRSELASALQQSQPHESSP
jgi:epoxyqueuosine reductase